MTQPYLGEIRLFPWDFAPRLWHLCDGSLIAINQNQALFSLLGTMYGGNGTTNFALPNLQGRTPIHRSTTYSQGAQAGQEQVTLTIGTMPAHTHLLYGTSTTANKRPAGSNSFANDTSTAADFYAAAANLVPINPASLGPAGGNQPHENMQPFLVMNYCIATQGAFPSRN